MQKKEETEDRDFFPESDEDNEGGMFEHYRFVADKGQNC